MRVQALHRGHELVLLSDGSTAPITNWVDGDGEECGAFDSPVAAVAGPDANGKWHSIVLFEFEMVEVH